MIILITGASLTGKTLLARQLRTQMGKKPVVLVMFYYSEPGVEITIQHPELEQVEQAYKLTAKGMELYNQLTK